MFNDIVITHFAGAAKYKNGKKLITIPLSSRKDATDYIRKLKNERKEHGYNGSSDIVTVTAVFRANILSPLFR